MAIRVYLSVLVSRSKPIRFIQVLRRWQFHSVAVELALAQFTEIKSELLTGVSFFQTPPKKPRS